ncbi:MAG TPA: fatty acid desaturase [Steroidobacteraceae bacterium]|nr:fatty acid desaturase [Steroidobacteraceae bacterium]
MTSDGTRANRRSGNKAWKQVVASYRQPSAGRAAWQLLNTLLPYALLWYAMDWALGVSYWLMLALALPAAGLLVRLFIIFHDCAHGSFFKSKAANTLVGLVAGALTFTPFERWRAKHADHHASSGDLDRRGAGDVWTLTVREYLDRSYWQRLSYRLTRNPVILLLVAPLFYFVVAQRFCPSSVRRRERHSVYWMNLAILGLAATLSAVLGLKAYLLIQLTVMAVAGTAGMWLFYTQHQFDGAYWERRDDWDYTAAALQGSSYYKLPAILRWFSGNIGFHHVHHLSPGIPNYNLRKCHDAGAMFLEVKPMTLLSSLQSLSLRLWDEERKQLVGFRHLRPAA